MAILIRTSDVPEALRLDAWRNIVCDTLGPLDFRIADGVPLSGEIAAGRLGSLTVGRVLTSTPHSVHRTPTLIRRDSPELYRVVLVISGRARVSQDGHVAPLGPGEFAIYDFTRPYDLAYDSAVQLAVFSLPHEILALPRGSLEDVMAVPITTEGGTGALAAPLLRRVTLDLETYGPASADRLSSVVVDLIAAAVAERAGQTELLSAESQQRTLLMRVQAFIEQQLGDADLGPGIVAAAHHISVRHLHRLFGSQNTTVAAWIRRRRLERCRTELANPTFHNVPVSAIAARWGLPDSAHFSRLFRQTYGVPPTEYRRTCLTPQT